MKHLVLTAIVMCVAVLGIGPAEAKTEPVPQILVSTGWLADHVQDPALVILHVGIDRKTYDAGHIAGARFLAWGDITTIRNGVPNQLPAPDVLQAALERVGVGDESQVIVYGDTPLLAGHTFFLLDYLGHANHAMLDGGLEAWKADKRAVTSSKPELVAAKLTVRAHPELLADLPAVQKLVAAKKIAVIDGRPPEQFSGATAGDGIKRGGHIPGAKNVWWMNTVVSKDMPVLKPVSEIRALYEAAGAKPGEDVLVYCRTGPIATHEYFTLKLLGFRPLLYNGSFMEWSNSTGTAVETGTGGSR